MKRLLAVVSLATCMWSCATGPSGPPLSVTGVISEKGSLTPLSEVQVQATFIPSKLTSRTTTDASGAYSISVPSGSTWVEVVIDGGGDYAAVIHAGPLKPGNTRLDFQLSGHQTYTLSGVVTEVTPDGVVPVEGVRIEAFVCDVPNCASYLDLVVTSDSTGRYTIPGLWAGLETALWITKAGYVMVDRPMDTGCHCDRLFVGTVDTQLDFQLVRQ